MADEMANDSTVNMNEDIPHTCGVCETIVNKNDLGLHPCFQGYTHFYVDDNFYCYPQCQNGNIVRNSLMADGSEAVVVTNAPVNTQHTEPTSLEEKKVALEEQLIDEVFKRPGLWNFKLPLTERSPQIKKKLWEEIFATLDGTLSIDAMKGKWKSLSDTFRIHLKKEQQVASGSAAKSGKKVPWVHFQRLQFLRDLQLQNKTVSNIEPLELDDSDSLEIASLDDSSNSSTNRGSHENGDIVRNSLMADGSEAVVVTNAPVNTQHTEPTSLEEKKVALEEQLIDEVFKRPGLWNFKLPLTERSLQIKKKLWEEIFATLDGTLSIDAMKRKWKSLSDTFRIHLKKEQQVASGSAAKSGKKVPWVHFQRLQFLRDLQLQNKTVSNIEPLELDDSDSLEIASLDDSSNSSTNRGSHKNGDIVRNSLMADGSEAVVVTNAPVNTQHTEPTSLEEKKVALEEQLIDEVFKRPGLWNFKLPLTERSLQIKKKLWEEIFATLDGTLSIDAMKRKWKSLSDTFRIHLKKEQQVASESAAKNGKKVPWVHFQRLQFLRDLQLQNKTVSNIEPLELDNSDSLEIASLDDSSNSSTNRGSHENGDIVRNSLMADGSEAVVVTNAPVNTQHTEPTSLEEKKVALEEQLIDEVFKRPGLWNFKLPLTERSPQIKKKLWEEIFATLDGTLSIDAMKRKWKSLSDTFRIHLKKEQQVASGSAAKSGKKVPWVHFQHLQFLRDLQLQNKTVSNIEPLELDDSDSLEIASLDDSSNSSTNRRSHGKRRSTDDVLDRIAESLTLPISLSMDQIEKILPRPQTDKPTLIGNLIAAQLRKIDPELLDEVMFEKILSRPQIDKPTLIGNLIIAQLREIDPELLDEVMFDILKITTDAKKRKT